MKIATTISALMFSITVTVTTDTVAADAASRQKPGVDATILISKEFAPAGKIFFAMYVVALDHLAIRAAETCPDGWDKLAEYSRGSGETPVLTWEIRCITPPATPAAIAPTAPR